MKDVAAMHEKGSKSLKKKGYRRRDNGRPDGNHNYKLYRLRAVLKKAAALQRAVALIFSSKLLQFH